MKRPNTWGNGLIAPALCLFAALAGLRAPAESPIAAEGVLEPDTIPFHRVAHYVVTVTAPLDTEIALAPWAETPPGLRVEVAAAETRALDGGKQQWRQTWTLTPAATGEYALPEVVVLAGDTPVATLVPGTLHVRALTPEEQANVEAPLDWIGLDELSESGPARGTGLSGLIALIAVVLAVAMIYRRYRARKPTRSPREKALAALQELDLALGAETVDSVEFHVRLAAILREYLAARFRTEATAMSTPEFARELLPELPLDPATAQALREVLAACDRVKYARQCPPRERCGRRLYQVRQAIALLESPPESSRGAA